jgi:general secretion pathway protein D
MIFLRPKIMRDPSQAAYETDLKYNYMQDQQRSFERREIPPLLPGEHQPRLPPLPPRATSGQEHMSPEEQARASAAKRAQEDAEERRAAQQQQQQALPQPPVAPPPPPSGTQSAPPTTPPQEGGQR